MKLLICFLTISSMEEGTRSLLAAGITAQTSRYKPEPLCDPQCRHDDAKCAFFVSEVGPKHILVVLNSTFCRPWSWSCTCDKHHLHIEYILSINDLSKIGESEHAPIINFFSTLYTVQ
jgi:hypothetical protein